MDSIKIEKKDGKWLINSLPYNEITPEEKMFFREFLIAMRLEHGCSEFDNSKNKSDKWILTTKELTEPLQ